MPRDIVRTAGVLAAAGLLAALASAPSASAAPNYGTGRPLAAIARTAGNVDVYWRGSDGFLYEKAESNGVWGPPVRTPIGGLASAPAAAIGSHGYDYVFWEGTDRNLWEAAAGPSGWIGPTKIGMGPLGSQPTAASTPNATGVSEIDVFWEGTNANLWRAEYLTSTGKWAGPAELGMGPLGSVPTATEEATSGGTAIQVYWKGSGNANLWEGHTGNGSTWSGPASLGMGPLGSAPSTASLSFGKQIVLWAGTTTTLWLANWNSASWTGATLNGPSSVGFGPMGSAPTVVPQQPDGWDVFWIGTDGNLWEATSQGGAWTGEQSLGSMTPPPPPPPPAPQPVGTSPATPPVTTTTTPGKTTVTIAPKKPHHVNANLTVTWKWHHARTRLRKLKFSRLPKHATIRVSCGGKHCPWQSIAVRKRERGGLISTLEHHVFRAGQMLTFKISSRGLLAERIGFWFRNGRRPVGKLLS